VVCRSVCLLVRLSVKAVIGPAKTAEPIEKPFGLRAKDGSKNHVLDGGPNPPWEGEISRAKTGDPL